MPADALAVAGRNRVGHAPSTGGRRMSKTCNEGRCTNLIAFAAGAARRTLRGSPSAWSGRGFFCLLRGNSRGTNSAKNLQQCYKSVRQTSVNPLISLVGAPRFELGTPSPPDCHRPLILLGMVSNPLTPES
jgi:hypothetical protein